MVGSVREDLERDMACLDLLGCIHGLSGRDQTVFQILQRADDALTVDDVADRLDCDRSTAYRSISRLLDAGVVAKRQVNYDDGGYYHVYRSNDPAEIARDMQRLLNDWYANVGQLIREFDETCGGDPEEPETRSLQSRS